jgi:alpha-glucosidase
MPERPVKPVYMQVPVYNRSRPETLGFIARLRTLLDSYPERFAVGEIASRQQLKDMVDYTDGPDRLHSAYSFVFLKTEFGAGFIRKSIEEMLRASETAWPSWAFSNHDVMRVASRWANPEPTPDFAKLMIALLGCLRGTIFLYQGEELGLPKANVPYERLQDPEGRTYWPDYESRDNARTPFPWASDRPQGGFSGGQDVEPWLPMEPAHLPLALDRQEADPDSVLSFTRRFLDWRKGRPALIDGTIRFLDAPEPVLAFLREKDGERLLCVFNLGPEPATADLVADGDWASVPQAGPGGPLDPRRLELPGHGMAFWDAQTGR